MKVTREQAQANRAHAVATAGEQFRAHGLDGIGIAGLMKAAGLSHGAFYGQFKSKEDLAVQACADAMAKNAAAWTATIHRADDEPLAALVAAYLSERQLAGMAKGCAMAALAPDVARHGAALQQTFTEGVTTHLAQLQDILPDTAGSDRRQAALAALAQMVGALVLARALDDGELARDLLVATAADLTGRLGRPGS